MPLTTFKKITKKQIRLMKGGDNPFSPEFVWFISRHCLLASRLGYDTDMYVWFKWKKRRPIIINDWRIECRVNQGAGVEETMIFNIKEMIERDMDWGDN